MRIEIWQGKGKLWFWHFKARNGKIVGDSEGFTREGDARRAAQSCVRAIFKRFESAEFHPDPPRFTQAEKGGVTVLEWR